MALVLKDRVRETTTTTGTGTITLAGVVTGYQAFSVIGDANTTFYCIAGQGTSEFEVGIGTYTLSGTTLARTTILSSSNAGSAVNFSAGTKDVFVTYPSSKSVNLDASGNVTLAGTLTASGLVTASAGIAVTKSTGNSATFTDAATYTYAISPSGFGGTAGTNTLPIIVNATEVARFTANGINGVLGGTTPAAASVTTLSASSTLAVGGLATFGNTANSAVTISGGDYQIVLRKAAVNDWYLRNLGTNSFAIALQSVGDIISASATGASVTGTLSAGATSVTTLGATGLVTVNTNGGTLPAVVGTESVRTAGANGSTNRMLLDSFGGVSAITFRRANTSSAAPSAVQSGDNLAFFSVLGYGATAYNGNISASFFSSALENWTDTAIGSKWTIQSTAIGTTTRSTIAEFSSGATTLTGTLTVTGAVNLTGISGATTVVLGDSATTASVFVAGTVDGADASRIIINGGGAGSTTRGGFLSVSGNENAGSGGTGGDVKIAGGGIAGSGVYIYNASTEVAKFLSGAASVTGTLSATGNVTLSGASANIAAGTTTTAGSLSNSTASSYVLVYGATNGTFPDQVQITAGGTSSRFSSTGLSVTGLITSSSMITATALTANGAVGLKLIGRSGTNDSQVAFFQSNGSTSCGFFNGSATGVDIYSPNSTKILGTTNTAVTITGTLDVSGSVTSRVENGFNIVPTATTGAAYFHTTTAGGDLYFGMDTSTGSSFSNIAGAYGTVIYRPISTAFAISHGATVDLSISSTGVVTIPGTLGVTGLSSLGLVKVQSTSRPQVQVTYNGTGGLYLEDSTNGSYVSYKLDASGAVGNDFNITPSTAVGGTTFTYPAIRIVNTPGGGAAGSAVTIPGTLTVTGAITGTASGNAVAGATCTYTGTLVESAGIAYSGAVSGSPTGSAGGIATGTLDIGSNRAMTGIRSVASTNVACCGFTAGAIYIRGFNLKNN